SLLLFGEGAATGTPRALRSLLFRISDAGGLLKLPTVVAFGYPPSGETTVQALKCAIVLQRCGRARIHRRLDLTAHILHAIGSSQIIKGPRSRVGSTFQANDLPTE